MWFLLKIFCFVWYNILPLFSIHYFSQEITLGRDNRLNFPPLHLGQREPGQRGPAHFNTKTIQHGPLCPRTFDGYIFHKLIPVNEIFVILPSIMSNEVCHHQMKGFFHIYFIKLSSVYTLVYQNKKSTQSEGGPLCPMRWPPLPKLLGKGGHFESKSIWLIIKIMYPWNTKWVFYMYLHCM